MFPRTKLRQLVFAAFLTAAAVAQVRADGFVRHRILIIHSYDRANRYALAQESAIHEVLAAADDLNAVIHVENLNCVGAVTPRLMDLQEQLFAHRYREGMPNLVITTDGPAFQFMLERGERLFPGVPVVFSAVNLPHWELDLRDREITGVVETLELKETIETAIELQPDLRRLIVIADDARDGGALTHAAESALGKIRRAIHASYPGQAGFRELLEIVRAAPADSAVLFLSHAEINEHPIPSDSGRLKQLCDASAVPVYSVYETLLGRGILGGKLSSGKLQGRAAAVLARRILRGERASAIPIVTDNLNVNVFDWQRMKQWGFDESDLPANSLVRNRKFTNYELYWEYYWSGALFLLAVFSIIVALLVASVSRRRVLGRLKENQELLRDVIESTDDPIFVKDLHGRYVLINSSDAIGIGAKVSDIVGKTDADFFAPDVAARIRASDRHLIVTGTKHVYEAQFRNSDSTSRTYLVHKFPRKDANGRTIGVIGIGRDITERKRSEEALQESEGRWRTLVENAPNLICITDRDGTVRFSNRRPPTGEVAGGDWCVLDFIRPEDRGRAGEAIERAWSRLALVDFECRSVSPIEPPTWYSCRVAPMTRSEAVVGLIVVAHDITLKKVAEQALQKMLAELELRVNRRTRELVAANRALKLEVQRRRHIARKNRRHLEELAHVHRVATMGELASGIAHELNQPLAAINGYARGGIRRIDSGLAELNHIRGALQHISDQARRAGEIIRGLRAFLQKEPGSRAPVEVNDAIRGVAALVVSEARRAGIELRLQLGAALPQVQANVVQIEQVVLNLVRNSFDAITSSPKTGGIVRILTRAAGNHVLIVVDDNGPGFSGDSAARLCEPFFTTKSTGMGLGLSISRSIVEAHGGRLELDATYNRGARIVLTLPGVGKPSMRLVTSGAA